jgi:hypothetical protein
VTSDELILGEEAVERRLLISVVSADREELFEVIPDDFQTGQCAGRAWLERRIIATN